MSENEQYKLNVIRILILHDDEITTYDEVMWIYFITVYMFMSILIVIMFCYLCFSVQKEIYFSFRSRNHTPIQSILIQCVQCCAEIRKTNWSLCSVIIRRLCFRVIFPFFEFLKEKSNPRQSTSTFG